MFRIPTPRITIPAAALLLAAVAVHLFNLAGASAGAAVFAPNVDFRQSANNEKNGAIQGLGNTHWLNSILQQSNSIYYEGMSTFQRTIITDVPATTGQVHTLTFSHLSTKGGTHAYDFLTSYDQALADNTAALNMPIALNPCGDEIGPPSSLGTTCMNLRSGVNKVDVVVPDDLYVSKDGSTADKIAAYEAVRGNRTIRLHGNAAISNASLTVCHDVAAGADGGDSYAHYTLTWTSTSTQILLEMAGHLAVTGTNSTGVSWVQPLGSSQISGGPYHFKMGDLGGAISNAGTCPQVQSEKTSLGSLDNQIKGADIINPLDACSIVGPSDVCGGSTNTYDSMKIPAGATLSWSITGNGTFTGGGTTATTASVSVVAGTTGSYTLSLTYTINGASATCEKMVTIGDTDKPVLGACPSDITAAADAGLCTARVNFTPPTATDNCGTPTVVCTPAAGFAFPKGETTVTCTATDAAGNSTSCSFKVTVNDAQAPTLNNCPTDFTQSTDANLCMATVNYPPPTASDNCTGVGAVSCSPAAGTTFAKGTTTVTCSVRDAAGNMASCSFTVTVNDTQNPTITVPPPPPVGECNNVVSFTPTVADNCPGVTFVCTPPSGSTFAVGVTNVSCKATDTSNNMTTASFTVTVLPNPPSAITGPSAACVGSNDVMYAGPANPGSYAYLWTVTGGAVIDGSATGRSIKVDVTGAVGGNYTVTLKVTDTRTNCFTSSARTVTIQRCDKFATLTQGAYGNPNGKWNGITRLPLVQSLLAAGSLVVGKTGINGRSVTIPLASAQCIINRLLAGGTPTALPSAMGNATLSAPTACQTAPTALPLGTGGKLNNVFLGQVITLSLNTRLTPTLSNAPLSNTFVTQRALPGPDGKMGTTDDVRDPGADLMLGTADDPIATFTISDSVTCALKNLGLPFTVGGLLELANRALAGQAIGGAALSNINAAVDAINRGFDECRFQIGGTKSAGGCL